MDKSINQFVEELQNNYPNVRRFFYGSDGWSSEQCESKRGTFRKVPGLIWAGILIGSIFFFGNFLPSYLLDNEEYFSPLGFVLGATILAYSLFCRFKYLEPRNYRYFYTHLTLEVISGEELEQLKQAPRVLSYLRCMKDVAERQEFMIADIIEMRFLYQEYLFAQRREEKRKELMKAINDTAG
jgi:hypothetical protein